MYHAINGKKFCESLYERTAEGMKARCSFEFMSRRGGWELQQHFQTSGRILQELGPETLVAFLNWSRPDRSAKVVHAWIDHDTVPILYTR